MIAILKSPSPFLYVCTVFLYVNVWEVAHVHICVFVCKVQRMSDIFLAVFQLRLLFFLYFLCVYHVYGHVCAGTHMYRTMHVEAQYWYWEFSQTTRPLYSLKWNLSVNSGLADRVSPARDLDLGSPDLPSSEAKIMGGVSCPPRSELQFSCLHNKCFNYWALSVAPPNFYFFITFLERGERVGQKTTFGNQTQLSNLCFVQWHSFPAFWMVACTQTEAY